MAVWVVLPSKTDHCGLYLVQQKVPSLVFKKVTLSSLIWEVASVTFNCQESVTRLTNMYFFVLKRTELRQLQTHLKLDKETDL